MATTTRDALTQLAVRADDLFIVMEPSLAECFGLARALRTACPTQRPRVVVWTTGVLSETLQLHADERRAYWRLAIGELADAADGRLTLVTHDAAASPVSSEFLRRPVHVTGYPTISSSSETGRHLQHVVCLGHVAVPCVRPMLEALHDAFGDAQGPPPAVVISWRSNQHDGRPGSNQRWATDLASSLGITLLDEILPSAMRGALAGADTIAILSDSTEGWLAAALAHAKAAGVPVITSTDPGDLVEQVALALDRRGARSSQAHGNSRDDAPAAVSGDVALAQLFDAACGHLPLVTSTPPPPPSASPPPAVREPS